MINIRIVLLISACCILNISSAKIEDTYPANPAIHSQSDYETLPQRNHDWEAAHMGLADMNAAPIESMFNEAEANYPSNTGGVVIPGGITKMSQLYFNEGIWDEKHIVSANWTNNSISRPIPLKSMAKSENGYD